MKSFFKLVLTLVIFSHSVEAQERDATDLSRYELLDEGETVKTLADIEKMEDVYVELVMAGNCEAALPKIVAFYEAANQVSNLIRRGNEPYYDANRDDKETITSSRKLLDILVKAENASNKLIKQRNKAWVEEAKCLITRGDNTEATTRLYRALDYISHDESTLWKEARNLLWEQVGLDIN